MTPALAFLILGAILVKAGWKNQNVIDVLLGRDTENPGGRVTDATDATSPALQPVVDAGASLIDSVTGGPSGMPHGVIQYDGFPVAAWIVPYLRWARAHGWKGSVTSGWRNPSRKITPSPGLPVAPQGKSNHNKTVFPGGAVDVSRPDELETVLRRFPGPCPLKRDPAIGDPIHFSATGR